MKKTVIWLAALVAGALLGIIGLDWINMTADFVATVYTRLFQLLAVPTIVLAVITTFATFLYLSCKKVVFLQRISREFWLILKLIEISSGINAMAFLIQIGH